MCWFFYFSTIFKLIRYLKIAFCTSTCSSNEIFNLLHLAVPVPSNAKAHVGNLWLQMKQESTNVFDYVWYYYAEVNSVSRVESNSCSSAGVAAFQRRGDIGVVVAEYSLFIRRTKSMLGADPTWYFVLSTHFSELRRLLA